MPDRKKQNGPLVPESVCPKCGLVHGVGELCTRFALNLAFDGSEAHTPPPPPPAHAAPNGPATEPGQVSRRGYFHHYRIACHPDGMLWELGSGAMGITYKAHDERLKLDVALKVINQTFMNDRGAQTLFLREARAAARVRHSNVASVLFLNDAPGNVFYAMEFVAGEPLNAWLKREGKIVPLVAIDVAKQLASGLGAIHAEGLIHRDLKPANVLLQPAANTATTADGTSFAHRSALRVKIIDFGVAREIATEVDAVSTIGFRGTVAYASPEQCEEHYDLDGRSDLYSLGCILFEMLAGHPPFAARSRRAFLNLHVTEPPPLHLLDDQPAILVAVIARLLAKNPEERYHDAQALVEALDAAEEKIERLGPVATAGGKHGSPVKVFSKWFGKVRRKMAGAPSSRHALPAPGHRRQKSRVWMIWLLALATTTATAAALYFRQSASVATTPFAAVAKPAAATPRAPLAAGEKRSLAVLPFLNASGDKDNSFYADGMRDDVLAQLARAHGFKVISSISREAYAKGDQVDFKKIARDLGVESVLDVVIRRSGNELNAAVSLIDVPTGANIWVEKVPFDATNVISVPGRIALNVAEQLNVDLLATEKSSMMRPATGSGAAYQFYLKGRGLMSDPVDTEKSMDDAVSELNQAIAADPTFALAHAELSMVHTRKYQWGHDRSDQRKNLAQRNAERAYRLQPELPEAQLAKGLYLYGVAHENDAALPYFQKASAAMPGNIDALTSIAAIDRRKGRWEKAVAGLAEAAELAPSDARLQFNLAGTYLLMRDFVGADRTISAALERNPRHPMLRKLRGDLYLAWKGDLGPMKEELTDRPPIPSADELLYDKIRLLLYLARDDEKRFDEAVKLLKESGFTLVDGEALYFTRDMLLGEILTQAGRPEEARKSWEMDLPQLAQSVADRPKDAGVRLAYALALSGTGQHEKAIKEATVATQLTPLEEDALNAPFFRHGLALIQFRAGNRTEAKALLDSILKVPSEYSEARLRASPAWGSNMF